MSKYLGIDPGYADCGWAALELESQRRLIIDAGQVTTDKGLLTQDRVRFVSEYLDGKLSSYRPVAVGIEAFTVIRGGKKGNHNPEISRYMNQLIGRLEQCCEARGIPVYTIPTQACKGSLGLRGKVTKAHVKAAVDTLFGTRVREHEADAVAAAYAAKQRHTIALQRGPVLRASDMVRDFDL